MQRLAVEPRVPMVDGMQFLSDKDPETHFMLQALLFRPVYLKPFGEGGFASRSEQLIDAYKELCMPPIGEPPW